MNCRGTGLRNTVVLFAGLAILGCSDHRQSGSPTGRSLGANSSVGKGTVSSYAEFDKNGAPEAIGLVFQAGALNGLPSVHSDGHHCFDHNNDGKLTRTKSVSARTSGSSRCPARRRAVRRFRSNGSV
jgi:hypothetical protein